MKAHEVKNYFKKLNIPVTVRNSKHFLNISIQPEPNENFRAPLVYKYEFPLEMRQKLLNIIYGDSIDHKTGSAGNIRSHMIALRRDEWEKFLLTN